MSASASTILDACLRVDEKADCTVLSSLSERVGVSALNDFAWNIRTWLPDLNIEKIAKLVKVFTRLELCVPNFCRGSTTQVHVLLHALDGRDPSLAEELRAWAFHTTKNPYVPFGTYGAMRRVAHSVADYYRLTHERRAKVAGDERLRSERAKERKAHRAISHVSRLKAHEMVVRKRAARVASIAHVDPTERLEAIARDDEHPPYYYPEEFANVDRKVLGSMDPVLLTKLASKLARAPRGKWRNLRRRLLASGIERPAR